jgi:hypothetical protein
MVLIAFQTTVSEHLKRPLYQVGTYDLGTSVSSLEIRLKESLSACAGWGAILLIDEADVFLE